MSTHPSVADTILLQLGGSRRLAVMIGADSFSAADDYRTLVFRFKGGRTAGNVCHITLDASDTYDLTFYSCRGTSYNCVGRFSGVYVDQLRSTFEKHTGLCLSL